MQAPPVERNSYPRTRVRMRCHNVPTMHDGAAWMAILDRQQDVAVDNLVPIDSGPPIRKAVRVVDLATLEPLPADLIPTVRDRQSSSSADVLHGAEAIDLLTDLAPLQLVGRPNDVSDRVAHRRSEMPG